MNRSVCIGVAACCGWLAAVGCQTRSTDAWIAQLNVADVQVRRAAAESLGEHAAESASAVPALERTLHDEDASVRLAAALAIAKIAPDNPNFPPTLIAALEAGHAPIFVEVARLGPDAAWAVPTLLQQLSHPQPQIRALAVTALGQIGVTADEEAALAARQRDPNPAVRRAAEKALEQNRARTDAPAAAFD